MTIKDWILLALGVSGAFSFGYTVGRQSVWSVVMDILAGYSGSAKKEKEKNKNKDKDKYDFCA